MEHIRNQPLAMEKNSTPRYPALKAPVGPGKFPLIRKWNRQTTTEKRKR
jgi:hypothetical protein